MSGAIERELSRRVLLQGAGGLLSLAGVVRMLEALDPAVALAQAPDGGGESGGDAVRETVIAFADTIVPGPAGGADRHPGAVEAGAVEEAYDDFYGLGAVFPALHADIQAATPAVLGRPASFDLDLPYPDRERVVLDRIRSTANGGRNQLYLAYLASALVVWFAYYGVSRSQAGMRYMRFKPHSDGYVPQHSYKIRFRGMSRDGNPR